MRNLFIIMASPSLSPSLGELLHKPSVSTPTQKYDREIHLYFDLLRFRSTCFGEKRRKSFCEQQLLCQEVINFHY